MDEIIAGIDAEIDRLEQTRSLLRGTASMRAAGRPAAKAQVGKKKRTFSAEAIARMADGQKARWAKVKKSAK
jgi:hypothetical protein